MLHATSPSLVLDNIKDVGVNDVWGMIYAWDVSVNRSQILFMPAKNINPDFTLSIRDGVRSFQVNVANVRTA